MLVFINILSSKYSAGLAMLSWIPPTLAAKWTTTSGVYKDINFLTCLMSVKSQSLLLMYIPLDNTSLRCLPTVLVPPVTIKYDDNH